MLGIGSDNVQASLSAGGYTFHTFLLRYDKVGTLTMLGETRIANENSAVNL